MTQKIVIPSSHPRYKSLRIREKLIEHLFKGTVAPAGLIAHGRGEAFDYLLGETIIPPAEAAIQAAAASILLAKHPVISVNGNTAALVAEDVASLAEKAGADVEVNLFYRGVGREEAVKRVLVEAGVRRVLGVGQDASARIPELGSERRRVDPRGILSADLVIVPLEDGDRTEALVKMGKKVVAIDLNPLSRTAQRASITIVGNANQVMPRLVEEVGRLRSQGRQRWMDVITSFDNRRNLALCLRYIAKRLLTLAEAAGPPPWEGEAKEGG